MGIQPQHVVVPSGRRAITEDGTYAFRTITEAEAIDIVRSATSMLAVVDKVGAAEDIKDLLGDALVVTYSETSIGLAVGESLIEFNPYAGTNKRFRIITRIA